MSSSTQPATNCWEAFLGRDSNNPGQLIAVGTSQEDILSKVRAYFTQNPPTEVPRRSLSFFYNGQPTRVQGFY